MTNRVIVYPGALPLDTDLLNTNRNLMIALGYIAQAAFGTGTQVDGLAITATTTPSLTVNVGPGSIYYYSVVDQYAYGSLSADSTDPLMKVGINISSTSFTLTAPSVSGQSINYLIEASFLEQDITPTVLSFYNAANPSQPYSGAANSGAASNTTRAQTVSLQLKAGTPAQTGSQSTPYVDTGWVGLYVITVNYGQTQITNTQLANCLYPGAPFIGPKLWQGRKTSLSANLTLYVSTSGSDSTGTGSSASPFATIQHAYNVMMTNYNFNGYTGTIQLTDGTYYQGATFGGMPDGYPPSTPLNIVGDTLNCANVIINVSSGCCFTFNDGAYVYVTGVNMYASGTIGALSQAGIAFNIQYGGNVMFDNVAFNTCGFAHINNNGGYIRCTYPGNSSPGGYYFVWGGASWHYIGTAGSNANICECSIGFSNSPAFGNTLGSTGFIGLFTGAVLGFWLNTFTGTIYDGPVSVYQNSILNVEGAGSSYLFNFGCSAVSTASQGMII